MSRRPRENSKSCYLHRLGCPKLDVDHDLLLAGLREQGVNIAGSTGTADVLVIATCAFISDSRAEAVEAIFAGIDWKNQAPGRRLYVSGCLPVLFRKQLAVEMPEVDGWFGPGDWEQAIRTIADVINGPFSAHLSTETNRSHHPGKISVELEQRFAEIRALEQPATAYLKIAEGCDRKCAYCSIPRIRGPYRSREPLSVLREAQRMLELGAREIVVIAEEVNSYGADLPGDVSIEKLLPELGGVVAKNPGGGWLRLLYTHPPLYSESFIDALVRTPALVPYLDFPIEHSDDKVLRKMRRGTTWRRMRRWIERLREAVPGIALRTSVIVGHPGEGPEEFATLLSRLEDISFERLGVFRFSSEEGTRAHSMNAPDLDETIKREEEVTTLALEQAESWYSRLPGRQTRMLVEKIDEHGTARGRTVWDAPDVDGEAVTDGPAEVGDILEGRVISAEPFLARIKCSR